MDGLMNVLELAKQYKFRIFAPSSIAVFGADVGKVAKQDSPLNPATMYGITKVAGELMADYYHSAHGVDIRGLRYHWFDLMESYARWWNYRLCRGNFLQSRSIRAIFLLRKSPNSIANDVHG